MQPRLFIKVLVLHSERLMGILVNPLVLFQTAPSGVFTVPQEIAMNVGHLSWDADLVAVEVVGLLTVYFFHLKENFNIFDNRFIKYRIAKCSSW